MLLSWDPLKLHGVSENIFFQTEIISVCYPSDTLFSNNNTVTFIYYRFKDCDKYTVQVLPTGHVSRGRCLGATQSSSVNKLVVTWRTSETPRSRRLCSPFYNNTVPSTPCGLAWMTTTLRARLHGHQVNLVVHLCHENKRYWSLELRSNLCHNTFNLMVSMLHLDTFINTCSH